MGAVAVLVEPAKGVVLTSQMPMHIDKAHAALPIGLVVWHKPTHLQPPHISLGDFAPAWDIATLR
jgi:hypothetical protein